MNARVAQVVRQMSVWSPAERLVVAGRILQEGHPELALAIASQVVDELEAARLTAGVLVPAGCAS